MDDLFSAKAAESLNLVAPLAEQLRPHSWADVVGQDHLVGPKGALRRAMGDHVPSMILVGPPGSGKTSLCRVIQEVSLFRAVQLSATTATVKDIRSTVVEATQLLGQQDVRTSLFLDEIHRFTATQQDALLPSVESGVLTLLGATTESPWATMNAALVSRCLVFRLQALADNDLDVLLGRAIDASHATMTSDARNELVSIAGGDGRRMLNFFEASLQHARIAARQCIEKRDVDQSAGDTLRAYTTGDHYDAISAFIKHMRAGNETQALGWLANMLDGGEDPRFIARRLMIFASEDVGVADSTVLTTVTSCAQAVALVGMPEAHYFLAHSTIVCANAPKSRSVGDRSSAARDIELLIPPDTH